MGAGAEASLITESEERNSIRKCQANITRASSAPRVNTFPMMTMGLAVRALTRSAGVFQLAARIAAWSQCM